MSFLRRPNDVWLRIWLILAWTTLSIVNYLFLRPLIIPRPGWLPSLELVIFSIFLVITLLLMWRWLKRSDCECWDDIKVQNYDCPDKATRAPKWQREVDEGDWEQEET